MGAGEVAKDSLEGNFRVSFDYIDVPCLCTCIDREHCDTVEVAFGFNYTSRFPVSTM